MERPRPNPDRLPRVEAIVVGLDGAVAASRGLRSSLVGEHKR